MTNEVSQAVDKTPAETPETTTGGRLYRPLTDIVETADGVTLMLEMPGVASSDVELEFERGVLTVKGRTKGTNPENYRLAYAEYGEGDYERVFTVSDDLDASKIKAEMRNGVLTVSVPRAAKAKPQRIAVKAG